MANSDEREDLQSGQLVRDIFATTDDEPDHAEIEAQMMMAAEAALSDDESKAQYPQIWHYFALYPSVEQEYRLLVELIQAEASDTLIQSVVLPPMPTDSTMTTSLHQMMQQSLAGGKRWIQDATGNVYVWLASAIQPSDSAVWVTRSDEPGALIFQETLSGIEGVENWEISVSAATETDETCQIDVSLYDLNDPDANLGEVLVSLQSGTIIASSETNKEGQASFAGINKTALAQLAVRIDANSRIRDEQ